MGVHRGTRQHREGDLPYDGPTTAPYPTKTSKSTKIVGIIYPHLGGILWVKSPMTTLLSAALVARTNP